MQQVNTVVLNLFPLLTSPDIFLKVTQGGIIIGTLLNKNVLSGRLLMMDLSPLQLCFHSH